MGRSFFKQLLNVYEKVLHEVLISFVDNKFNITTKKDINLAADCHTQDSARPVEAIVNKRKSSENTLVNNVMQNNKKPLNNIDEIEKEDVYGDNMYVFLSVNQPFFDPLPCIF